MFLQFICAVFILDVSADRRAPKSVYRVAVYDRERDDYIPTFETYLNEVVGPKFNPPISFQTGDLLEGSVQGFDFALLDTRTTACVMAESSSWTPIATLCESGGGDACDSELGAVIFTRANNTEVNKLKDLKNKKIGVYKTQYFQSFMVPNLELIKNRMIMMADAAQIQTRVGSTSAYREVISGDLDAAFVSTGKLESLERLGIADLSLIKVLSPKDVSSSGTNFTERLSTPTYPQKAFLFSGRREDELVAVEVSDALMAINYSHPAAISGEYSKWLIPSSYNHVHQLLEDVGYITTNSTTKARTCKGWDSSTYETLSCPEGYFLHSNETVWKQCREKNITCPDGRECLCKPCKKAKKHEVQGDSGICSKMNVCYNTTQLEPVKVSVTDNARTTDTLRYDFHATSSVENFNLEAHVSRSEDYTYTFEIASSDVGQIALEIFLDNGQGGFKQIETSPILIQVQPRQCPDGFKATRDGECQNEIRYLPEWAVWVILGMFLIAVLLSATCAIWTCLHRETKIVHAAQAPFLYLICLGCFTSSLTLFLLQLDDNPNHPVSVSATGLNIACASTVWLYAIGFCLTVSAIYSKLLRTKRLMLQAAKGQQPSTKINPYLLFVCKMLAVETVILVIWTTVDMPEWTRSCADDGDFCESVGHCSAGLPSIVFIALLLVLHLCYLIYVLLLCYEVRSIPQEFAEHKWITAASISSMEVHLIAPLVIVLVWDDITAKTVLLAAAIFFNDVSILLMVFLPKMMRLHFETHDAKSLTLEDQLHNLRREVRNIPGDTRKVTFMDVARASKIEQLENEVMRLRRQLDELNGGNRERGGSGQAVRRGRTSVCRNVSTSDSTKSEMKAPSSVEGTMNRAHSRPGMQSTVGARTGSRTIIV
uniref:G-protein coupled receptors family 3 profile domain-containing protein n=1 Tax=Lotharella globosa TaxID=91324 RepID=A0A7S4DY40_9EUKA|mmetsp:Transcript_574/g.1101  ORF Transcript_574/g.1101 Transcript_574/m.1101 type:complete len:883 (-) Transcript_574:546-3194(-)